MLVYYIRNIYIYISKRVCVCVCVRVGVCVCVCVCVCVLPAAPREEAKKKRGRREFWALGKLIVCHAWELGP